MFSKKKDHNVLCISLEGKLAMLYSCSFIRALSTVYSLFRFHFNFSLFQPIRHGNTKLSHAFLLQFTQCAKNWAKPSRKPFVFFRD